MPTKKSRIFITRLKANHIKPRRLNPHQTTEKEYSSKIIKYTTFNYDSHVSYKGKAEKEKYKFAYAVFDYSSDSFCNYFRYLYHTLKRIKEQKDKRTVGVKDAKKRKHIYIRYADYAKISQAQMSFNELSLLFYNSLAYKKLAKLVVYYQSVENLLVTYQAIKEHADNIYGIEVKFNRF